MQSKTKFHFQILVIFFMIGIACLTVVYAEAISTTDTGRIGKLVLSNETPPALPDEVLYSTPRIGSIARGSYSQLAGLTADYSISLLTGYNLISVPRTLAEGHNTAATVFSGIDTGGHSILEYDGSTHSYITVTGDTIIRPLDGIFIYSTSSQTVPLYFKNDPRQRLPTKPIYSGWNLIGFSDISQKTARDTLISVVNVWTQAQGFDAVTQSYETQIINGGSGQFSDYRAMYPGKGYWLYSTGSGTLVALSK